MARNNNYAYGRRNESRVARLLQRMGYETQLSPGSRGACDIRARKEGISLCVQVKSSRMRRCLNVSPREAKRIRQQAAREKATPIIARVQGSKIELTTQIVPGCSRVK